MVGHGLNLDLDFESVKEDLRRKLEPIMIKYAEKAVQFYFNEEDYEGFAVCLDMNDNHCREVSLTSDKEPQMVMAKALGRYLAEKSAEWIVEKTREALEQGRNSIKIEFGGEAWGLFEREVGRNFEELITGIIEDVLRKHGLNIQVR